MNNIIMTISNIVPTMLAGSDTAWHDRKLCVNSTQLLRKTSVTKRDIVAVRIAHMPAVSAWNAITQTTRKVVALSCCVTQNGTSCHPLCVALRDNFADRCQGGNSLCRILFICAYHDILGYSTPRI